MTALVSFAIALAGIAMAACRKRSVPESISEIGYLIPHWAFSSWVSVVGILLMPDMMDRLPGRWQWMGFMSVMGLLCVAASSYYRTESKALHYIGGWTCALCALAVVVVLRPWLMTLWAVFLLLMVAWPGDKWLFWAEVMVYCLLQMAVL